MISITRKTTLSVIILLLSLTTAWAGKNVISEIPLEIRAGKAPFFNFSGANAHYILLRDKDDLVIIHLDTALKTVRTTKYNLDQVLYIAEPLAAAETGPYVTVLMSDKKHEHFSTLKYNIQTGEVRPGVNFDTGDYDYFGWYPRRSEIMLIAIQRKTSHLSMLSIDSAGPGRKYNFDLTGIRFKRWEQTTLYSTLSTYTPTMIAANEYVSDVNTTSYAKLYYGQDTVAISLSVRTDSTQLILLDLAHQTYTNLLIPNLLGKAEVGDLADGNAFLSGNLLTTVFVYSHTLNVGIYDIFKQKYVATWSSNGNMWDALISGPLLYEDLMKVTSDTIEKRDKFISRMCALPILSVATDRSDGGMNIYVGALERPESSGVGMMMMPMGGGMVSVATGGSWFAPMSWPWTKRSDDEQLRKHYYFVSRIDLRSFHKSAPDVLADNYQKLNISYFDNLHMSERHYICKFRQGDKFYLGYYTYEDSKFFIRDFK